MLRKALQRCQESVINCVDDHSPTWTSDPQLSRYAEAGPTAGYIFNQEGHGVHQQLLQKAYTSDERQ